jgi:hypothetical protein
MKRLVLITVLLLSNGPAYGEWIKIVDSEQLGMTVYGDPKTVRRTGDLVKLWVLFDSKTIQTMAGDSFMSSKGQNEFDCAEERMRVLTFTHFPGNTVRKSACVCLRSRTSRAIWEAVKWFIATQPNSSGSQLYQ